MRGRRTGNEDTLAGFFSSNSKRQIMIHPNLRINTNSFLPGNYTKTVSNLPDAERFCVDKEMTQWIVTEAQWINDEWKENAVMRLLFILTLLQWIMLELFWWNVSIVKKNDNRNKFTFSFMSSTQNVGTNQILIYKKNKLNATKDCIIVGTTASVCPKVFIS